MGNEAFDEKIKAKLESIQPPFEESSWEKIAPMLGGQSGGGWMPSLAQWMYVAASVGTIVYLLYRTVQVEKRNASLQQQVQVGQQQEPNIVQPTQHDTVYVTRFVDRFLPATKANSIEIATSNDKINNLQTENQLLKQEVYTKSKQLIDQKVELFNAKTSNEITIAKTDVNENPGTKVGKLPEEEQFQGVITEIGKNEKSTVVEQANQPGATFEQPKEKVTEKLPEIAQNRPAAAKSKWFRPSVGLSTMRMRGTIGGGLLTNFYIKNGLSLNVGLDRIIQPMFFKNETEFKKKIKDFRGSKDDEEFRDRLGPWTPPGGLYTDIKGFRNFVELPVSVQYNYDLNNNLGIFLNAGTNVTLLTRDDLEFKYSQTLGQFEKTDIKKSLDVKPFNSFSTSLGVQGEWRKFIVQASPNYIYRNLPQSRFKDSFGLKFSLMYRLW